MATTTQPHEQNIPVPALDKANTFAMNPGTEKAILHCSTAKALGGGIYSQCNIQFNTPEGFTTFAIGGDYRRVLERDPKARATQKALAAQHARNFSPAQITALIEEATAFYANKKVKS